MLGLPQTREWFVNLTFTFLEEKIKRNNNFDIYSIIVLHHKNEAKNIST